MDDYSDSTEQQKVSDYNSSGLLNLRLHSLWLQSNMARLSGNYKKWNVILDSIWSELASDVDEDTTNGKKEIDKYNEFSQQLAKSGHLVSPIVSGFGSLPTSILQSIPKQYAILQEKEVWLRRLQNKQGKGTKYKNQQDTEWE